MSSHRARARRALPWALVVLPALFLQAGACAVAPQDADYETLDTPIQAAFTAARATGSAFFTYRITGDVTPSPAASSIANDASRNMDGAGNQCMVPLERGEGYDDLHAAGVHFPTLAGITGLPLGAFCNTCVELTVGSVTQRVRVVDSLRDGQDVYDTTRGLHFDLHASTYKAFQDEAGQNPADIRGATWRIVPCGEPAIGRRYAVRHFAGGSWFQLQARHSDIPIHSLELVDGSGRVLTASAQDHTGFFTFSAQEGTRYAVRMNGADVRDVVKLPTATTDTESRANGPWSAAVVKGELQSLQERAPAPPAAPSSPPSGAASGAGATPALCTDAPPAAPSGQPQYSCETQKNWGKCGETWMTGYCATVCGTCAKPAPRPTAACTNDAPPAASGQTQYSCDDQRRFGKCGETWMQGYCASTCNTCAPPGSTAACTEAPPPAAAGQPQYSCDDQKRFGKCGETWMRGYCRTVCGGC